MNKFIFLTLLIGFTGGCVTTPTQQGQVYSAAYVGDRSSMNLNEIVVTIPQGEDGRQNLHIFLSAIINPTKTTTKREYDVRTIIHDSSTRIAAQLVTDLTSLDAQLPAEIGDLRELLASKAQAEFNSIYSKWTHADAFQVEIVVTSLFFSDGSVGKSPSENRFWW